QRVSGRGDGTAGRGAEHGEDREGVGQNRGLRVVGGGQLVLRPFEHQPAEGDAEGFIDRAQRVARRGEARGEVFGHPDFLGALPGAQPDRVGRGYHCTTRLAQVKPAPNAQNITFMPGLRRPPRTASSSAIATDAAEVLPQRSTLSYTLSMARPAC